MAAVRKTRSGKYELCISHQLLPKRLYFTFESEVEAENYALEAEKWLKAGIVPAALVAHKKDSAARAEDSTMQALLLRWCNAGRLSKTDQDLISWMTSDKVLMNVRLSGLTYPWAESWVEDMKLSRNLAPSSIRQRVQAVSKAIDWHIRSNPHGNVVNPLKLLPRGYSIYHEAEARVLRNKGQDAKHDQVRNRRLLPGEFEKIREVLRGERKKPNSERGVGLHDGAAMLVLFETIVYTGARLREAYTLRKDCVDLIGRTIKIKTTKQRHGKVAYRTVPIRPELIETLRNYIEVVPGDLVFPFWDGDPNTLRLASGRLSHRFTSIFQHAECEGLTEHDLRHEATCQWFELRDANGRWLFRPEEINKIMGWSATSVMSARYASFRAESLSDRLWEGLRPNVQQGSSLPTH